LKLDPNIIIAIITSCSSLIAALFSIRQNNNILGYKVDELKKQVERHNTLVERVYKLESDTATQWKRHDELKARVDRLEDKE